MARGAPRRATFGPMPQSEIIQAELAQLAGVSRTTAGRAMRQELKGDLTESGRRVYRDAPRVQAWIKRYRHRRKHGNPPPVVAATPLPPAPPVFDPFAAARAAAPPVVVLPSSPPELEPLPPLAIAGDHTTLSGTDRVLEDLRIESLGRLPPIKDFRHRPFDEVLDTHGTLEALVSAVKASKLYGEMRAREQEAAAKRGDLVERRIVTAVLAPIVDLAFSRLVGEAPAALRDQIVARVMSGGDDLAIDVETLIRQEVAGILGDAKSALATELEKLC